MKKRLAHSAITRLKRTGLVKLVEASERRGIRGFACVRVARFFRNTGLGKAIYTRLQRVGARLVFAEYPRVDVFTTEGYKWFINELAGAETWSLDHALRVRDGKTAKYERGESNASVAGFGAKSRKGVLRWTKDALIVRDAIRALHDDDKSPRVIALELSEKYQIKITRQMVLRWIKSPRYYGMVRHTPTPHGKQNSTSTQIKASRLRKAKWKGIALRRWFYENQLILQAHATGGKASHDLSQHKYLYGGRFLSCSHCGGSLYADMRLHKRTGDKKEWVAAYLCSNHRRDLCDVGARAVRENDVTRQLADILSFIRLPDDWKALVVEQSRKAKTSNDQTVAKLRGIQRQREQAALEYAALRDMDTFTRRIAELDKSEAALKTQHQPTGEAQFAAIARELENMTAMLAKATNEERSKIMRRIFSSVGVDVVTKRVVRFEVFPSSAVLLQSVDGFHQSDGVYTADGCGELDKRILAAIKELGGQAMAYQIVEHSGVDHKELRLRIPALRKAGLIEQRGFANVAAQKSKRVKIWALPNTMSRDSNDAGC